MESKLSLTKHARVNQLPPDAIAWIVFLTLFIVAMFIGLPLYFSNDDSHYTDHSGLGKVIEVLSYNPSQQGFSVPYLVEVDVNKTLMTYHTQSRPKVGASETIDYHLITSGHSNCGEKPRCFSPGR